MEMYPSNSHKSREEAQVEERKKLDKIVTGNVKTRKKTGADKCKEAVKDKMKQAGNFVLKDIIIPGVKTAISKTFDILIWGEDAGRKPGGIKPSYRSYYDQPYGGTRTNRSYDRVEPVARGFSYDEIIFDNRGEAEHVLTQMDELVSTYGMVSVADLYDLVGMSCDYTYNKYGWTNIRNARIERVRDGFLLEMPKALPIK